MKTYRVQIFKPSGKWYTDEEAVALPNDAMPWHFMEHFERAIEGRFRDMTVVIIDAPWGYPALFTIPGAA